MARSSFVFPIIAFAILAGAQFSYCQESWWDFYDLALKDMRAKNWNLAEERFKAAFRLNSEQGPRVRPYGARFIRYFPEYYLAVVHFHQGKNQEALEEFLRVQNKGLIKEGDEEYAELTRLRQQAFAKLNPPSAPPAASGAQEQYASLIDKAQNSLISRRYEEARNFATQAISLDKNNPKGADLLTKNRSRR